MGAFDKLKSEAKEAGKGGELNLSIKLEGDLATQFRVIAGQAGVPASKVAHAALTDFVAAQTATASK